MSEVVECNDGNERSIPFVKYNPVKLIQLPDKEIDSSIGKTFTTILRSVDVVVILREVGELTEITTKREQKQLLKRALLVLDDTAITEITLWGDEARTWDIARKLPFFWF
jgi:hypothetical protein